MKYVLKFKILNFKFILYGFWKDVIHSMQKKKTHTNFSWKICRGDTSLKTRVSIEENIKINLKEMNVDWNILAQSKDQQRRPVHKLINFHVSWKGGHNVTKWATSSFPIDSDPFD